jgi:glycosyltransferase involved in cell wall biosynthesis
MMYYDIIIPTCQSREAISKQIEDIRATIAPDTRIIVTGFNISAAANRNYGLHQSTAPYIIMLDDDITGFFPGWADMLVEYLQPFNFWKVAMVSARLINADGTLGTMMDIEPDLRFNFQLVNPPGYLPSACVAFWNDGSRFDESFEGSSWEDTDFCDTLHLQYPGQFFVIANDVRLIHNNEMKNGTSQVFERNKRYYMQKHPERGVNV